MYLQKMCYCSRAKRTVMFLHVHRSMHDWQRAPSCFPVQSQNGSVRGIWSFKGSPTSFFLVRIKIDQQDTKLYFLFFFGLFIFVSFLLLRITCGHSNHRQPCPASGTSDHFCLWAGSCNALSFLRADYFNVQDQMTLWCGSCGLLESKFTRREPQAEVQTIDAQWARLRIPGWNPGNIREGWTLS